MPGTHRCSFTIPETEMEALRELPRRLNMIEPVLNISEIIRIGIFQVQRTDPTTINEILEKTLGRLVVGKPKKATVSSEDDRAEELTVTDKQWAKLQVIIAKDVTRKGRPSNDDRSVLDAILFVFGHKTQRREVPQWLGSYATVRRRLNEWKKDQRWSRICRALVDHSPDNLRQTFESVLLRTWFIDTNNDIR